MKKRLEPIEDDLQKQCEKYMNDNDIDYLHFKNQAHYKNRNHVAKSFKDRPDFYIFLNHRLTIMIELKSKTGEQTEGQVEYMNKKKAQGFPFYVCRTFEEFLEAITIPIGV